jgi:putative transposase
MDRRKKGSINREKARLEMAKTHETINNQRNDFIHKLSRQIVSNYQTVCVESLAVKKMVGNHQFAESIADASWGTFHRVLDYNAANAGSQVMIGMPFDATTRCAINAVQIGRCPFLSRNIVVQSAD